MDPFRNGYVIIVLDFDFVSLWIEMGILALVLLLNSRY